MSRDTVFATLGWIVAAGFLVAGVPPFLRMPLWGDTTLYDVAARTVLAGGVHYRDVFDTNPPGFVWLMCGIRLTLGTSTEAVRVVDLGIVVLVVACLLVWARRCGASHAGVAWAAAAAAAFYPFIDEFNHAQRDIWMMLPAVAAIGLRLRRLGINSAQSPPTAMGGLCEGLLWGFGCWIKPHMLFMAAAVWLVTAGRFGSRRRALLDLAAVFAGGVAAGLAGLAWLIESGSWPYFLDVWRTWNTAYAKLVRDEFLFRLVKQQFTYFPPYSIFSLLAIPLAVRNLRGRSEADPALFRRSVLAAVYLAWLLTTLLFQRGYHYTHVPETLLMLAVFAANRWPVPCLTVLIQIVVGVGFLAANHAPAPADTHRLPSTAAWVSRFFAERNPAFDPKRARWWLGCLDADVSRELRRGVGMYSGRAGGLDPVELGAVADFLRSQNVHDGELITWHDSPHALYLELGIRPGLRFMHVAIVMEIGSWQSERVLKELQAAIPHARFAVSDLCRITDRLTELSDPDWKKFIPAWQWNEFPFDQPVVFRSPGGRFLVHEIKNPVRSCEIPRFRDQNEPNRK